MTTKIQEFIRAWDNAEGQLTVALMRKSKQYQALKNIAVAESISTITLPAGGVNELEECECETTTLNAGGYKLLRDNDICPLCGDAIDVDAMIARGKPNPKPMLTMMENLQAHPNTYAGLDNHTRTAFRILSNYFEKYIEVKK